MMTKIVAQMQLSTFMLQPTTTSTTQKIKNDANDKQPTELMIDVYTL